MEPFPNIDIATQVLLRLPPKSLVLFKCTSKRWYRLLSHPSFVRIYDDERLRDTFGLFMQHSMPETQPDSYNVNHVRLTQTGSQVDTTSLDFLPEKVVLVASSNGMLCCRSWIDTQEKYNSILPYSGKPCVDENIILPYCGLSLMGSQKEFSLYICNPITKHWVQVRPTKHDTSLVFGFVFYPSSQAARSSFKLVNLQQSQSSPDSYSFAIYSSETRKWRMWKEVCKSPSRSEIFHTMVVFCNGTLHWRTTGLEIVTFHVEEERSKIINLPARPGLRNYKWQRRLCFGESSEGHLHYLCVGAANELYVWVLKDYETPSWELKHTLDLLELYRQYPRELDVYPKAVWSNKLVAFSPVACYGDVVYVTAYGGWIDSKEHKRLISVGLRSGTLMRRCSYDGDANYFGRRFSYKFIVHPHQTTLMPLPPYSNVRRRPKRCRSRGRLDQSLKPRRDQRCNLCLNN